MNGCVEPCVVEHKILSIEAGNYYLSVFSLFELLELSVCGTGKASSVLLRPPHAHTVYSGLYVPGCFHCEVSVFGEWIWNGNPLSFKFVISLLPTFLYRIL